MNLAIKFKDGDWIGWKDYPADAIGDEIWHHLYDDDDSEPNELQIHVWPVGVVPPEPVAIAQDDDNIDIRVG